MNLFVRRRIISVSERMDEKEGHDHYCNAVESVGRSSV
jgi:hypothetical protein